MLFPFAIFQNLYAMCEIAQELIKFRAQHNNWTIPTFPGKIKLPHDILRPQPNAEIANKVCDSSLLGIIYLFSTTSRSQNKLSYHQMLRHGSQKSSWPLPGFVSYFSPEAFATSKLDFRKRKSGRYQPNVKRRQQMVIQSQWL